MLYKELIAARPLLWATVLIGGLLLAGELISKDSLQGVAAVITGGAEGLLLVAFAIGHGQIGPEIALGHVQLLDGLPVGRTQVYAAKLLVGVGAIALLVGVVAGGELAMIWLTWGVFAPETIAHVFGALAVGLFAFYGTGLVLSWFGGFGWALLGLGLTAVMTAAELNEQLRPLSLFHGYGTVRFEANVPVLVTWPLTFWGVYGVGCVVVSGLLFVGGGDRIVVAGSVVGRGVRSVALAGIAGLLVLMAVVSSARLASRGQVVAAPEVLRVDGFRVLVPADRMDVGGPLAQRLPAIDAAVRSLLGETAPVILDIELGGGGRFHAGRYTGGKIRMALDGDAEVTLAHELAHAYADRMSAGRLVQSYDALRFFSEGLAVWVAERALERPPEPSMRAWAAAIYTLGHHSVDLLMTDQHRSTLYDPFEPYPLGTVFVEGVVDVGGQEALRCLVRGLAELPERKLAGSGLWGRLVDECRLPMAKIVEAYEARLAQYAERYPMPVRPLIGKPRRTSHGLLITLPDFTADGDLEDERRCRFRSRLDAAAPDLEEVEVRYGVCSVAAVIGATDTISYQIGTRLPLGWTIFGPWLEQPIPKKTSTTTLD